MESILIYYSLIRSGGRYTLPPHFQESDNRHLDTNTICQKLTGCIVKLCSGSTRKFLTFCSVNVFSFLFVSAHAHTISHILGRCCKTCFAHRMSLDPDKHPSASSIGRLIQMPSMKSIIKMNQLHWILAHRILDFLSK